MKFLASILFSGGSFLVDAETLYIQNVKYDFDKAAFVQKYKEKINFEFSRIERRSYRQKHPEDFEQLIFNYCQKKFDTYFVDHLDDRDSKQEKRYIAGLKRASKCYRKKVAVWNQKLLWEEQFDSIFTYTYCDKDNRNWKKDYPFEPDSCNWSPVPVTMFED